MSTDPRHLVYGNHAAIPGPHPARAYPGTGPDGQACWEVSSLGTRPLGYIYIVQLNHLGEPVAPKPMQTYNSPPVPEACTAAKTFYRATDPTGQQFDSLIEDFNDAIALIVGAAHSSDPHPEHTVPRNVGGRPITVSGEKFVNFKPGDELLARLDEAARAEGRSRADLLRQFITEGLDRQTSA